MILQDPYDPYGPDPDWDPNQPGLYVPPPAGQVGVVDPAYDWMTDPNATPPNNEYFWNGTRWEHQGPPGTGGTSHQPPTLPGGTTTPVVTPPVVGSGSSGGGGYTGGSTGWEAQPDFSAPRWTAPPEFVYAKQFEGPNAQTLQQDPSFQFRMDQGRKALEQSAAGKGVLRTGGTLKDLVNYGQNFATNEYANVYNRKFNEYKFDYDKEADIYAKNYNLKRDVFDRNYKAAYDEYQPKLRGWETKMNRDYNLRKIEQQDLGYWPNP